MSIADPISRDTSAPARERDSRTGRGATLRVLAVVDGSERSGRVMKCLIGLYVGRGPIEVVLLNVQPKPQDWRLRGYGWFQRQAIHDRLINELGQRVIASAARHLDSAGVGHKDRIELGEPGETILRCAREEDCDVIVLAEARPGPIGGWLLRTLRMSVGSFGSVVVHLAGVPVVVVP